MTEPASGRSGRPAAVARVCRELSQRGAHHRAGQHVGRVVHAVWTREYATSAASAAAAGTRGRARSRTRRRRRSGRRETSASSASARGARAGPRLPDVGAPPCERLDGGVDHGRLTPSDASPGRRGGRSPEGSEREARVVGGAREAAHRDVERRGRCAGDGGVDREIEALGVLDPARTAWPRGRGFGVGTQGGGIL